MEGVNWSWEVLVPTVAETVVAAVARIACVTVSVTKVIQQPPQRCWRPGSGEGGERPTTVLLVAVAVATAGRRGGGGGGGCSYRLLPVRNRY